MTPRRWLHSPVKRAIDAAVAAAVLVVASPIIAATAIAVRVRLGSPVLFRQARAGHDGQPIEIVKFRSMTDARGADGELLPDDQRLPRVRPAPPRQQPRRTPAAVERASAAT